MNDFFMYTNPLTWVYFIILILWFFLQEFLAVSGIADWYFCLFQMNSMEEQFKEDFIKSVENKDFKFFWFKEQAWLHIVKKLKNE